MPSFHDGLQAGYGFDGPSITLGAALEGATVHPTPKVCIPLAMMNRHGLVAGATGTGKTKTLQLLAEQLSAQGVPVFVADIKGDLSGLAMPGESNPRIAERATSVGWDWKGAGVPVEFVSLTGRLGVQLRATVSSFGPLLLGKVLSLNETQTSVLALVFKFCDDQGLPLLDFGDLRAVLQYLSSDEGKPALAEYGGMSPATVGVLLRKMVELEGQGAEAFFGEPEFDVRDLLTPLGKMAERTGAAVLGIMHVGKPTGTNRRPVQQLLGATAFGAVARVVMMVAPISSEQTETRRALAVVKSNLAMKPPALEWSMDGEGLPIAWHGISAKSIEELLGGGVRARPRDDAEVFVRETLADGPMLSSELTELADEAGFKETTLRRAIKAVGPYSWKQQGVKDGPWWLSLEPYRESA